MSDLLHRAKPREKSHHLGLKPPRPRGSFQPHVRSAISVLVILTATTQCSTSEQVPGCRTARLRTAKNPELHVYARGMRPVARICILLSNFLQVRDVLYLNLLYKWHAWMYLGDGRSAGTSQLQGHTRHVAGKLQGWLLFPAVIWRILCSP